MKRKLKVVALDVYRNGVDCTNGGVSSKSDTLYVVDNTHGAEIEVEEANVFTVDYQYAKHVRLMPAYDKRWAMFGGNIATLGRYRGYKNHYLEGVVLSIHDRFETPEQNEILSR